MSDDDEIRVHVVGNVFASDATDARGRRPVDTARALLGAGGNVLMDGRIEMSLGGTNSSSLRNNLCCSVNTMAGMQVASDSGQRIERRKCRKWRMKLKRKIRGETTHPGNLSFWMLDDGADGPVNQSATTSVTTLQSWPRTREGAVGVGVLSVPLIHAVRFPSKAKTPAGRGHEGRYLLST